MPCAAFPSGRKSLLLFVLAAVVSGGAWWWQRPPPEPVYHGQRLSAWVAARDVREDNDLPLRIEELRAFGPAAVTWLAYTVEHGRHPFYKVQPLPFDHAPDWLRRWLPERWGGLRIPPVHDERVAAVGVLARLGPEAAPAIPALIRSLENEDENLRDSAAATLHAIGPASWPAIQEVLAHGNMIARYDLLDAMDARIGSREEPAPDAEVARVAAALVQAFRDPEPAVRSVAATTLETCVRRRPNTPLFDSTISALIPLLADSQKMVWEAALEALEQFGPKATPAVPVLIQLLDSPEAEARYGAIALLGKLDVVEQRSADRMRVMLYDADSDCRAGAVETLKAFGLSAFETNTSGESLPAR